MSFGTRVRQHDEQAVTIVVDRFKALGFKCYSMGTETNAKEMQKALRAQYNHTSLMMRFRPDKVFVKRGARSLLCEIKSESEGYPNFAIEVDSYDAAVQWNGIYNHVMHAFVELPKGLVKCCWLNDIPRPERFYVPRRHGYRHTVARLERCWNGIEIEVVVHRGGSGTAHFYIPKSAPYLVSFDQFISSRIGLDDTLEA